jgi:hypothetical protein
VADEPYGGSDPTADDCIRAGLYWFSRRDLEAARAWWERAVFLDPHSVKAQECLRLLQSFETRMGTLVPEPAPEAEDPQDFQIELLPDPPPPEDLQIDFSTPAAPPIDPLFDRASNEERDRDLGSLDLDNREWSEAMRAGEDGVPMDDGVPMGSAFLEQLAEETWEAETDPTPSPAPQPRGVWPPPRDVGASDDLIAPDIPALNADPLDFAAASDPALVSFSSADPDQQPWDAGPSRTSVVTLDNQYEEFDAVAEPTPLPDIDKERFFGRVQDDASLIEYMRSTGDLVMKPPTLDVPREEDFGVRVDSDSEWEMEKSGEIIFEDAVEMAPPAPKREKRRSADQLLAEARDRMSLHDFQGVLDFVQQIPAHQRNDEANKLFATSRANLLKMYESKIGPTDRVPKVRLSTEEVIWLNLNHRAGFILSQIDGAVTYEDLIALSGMDRLDTVRILAELVSQKVIGS